MVLLPSKNHLHQIEPAAELLICFTTLHQPKSTSPLAMSTKMTLKLTAKTKCPTQFEYSQVPCTLMSIHRCDTVFRRAICQHVHSGHMSLTQQLKFLLRRSQHAIFSENVIDVLLLTETSAAVTVASQPQLVVVWLWDNAVLFCNTPGELATGVILQRRLTGYCEQGNKLNCVKH